jgi:uncharacterized protein with PIN domain
VVLDTSAILAILFAEPEAALMVGALALGADRRLVGAPTWVEAAAILLARKGPAGGVALDALLQRLGVEVCR